MKIELQRPYKSVATLTIEEVPDFAVLIGRNGVGKSQLLEAIGSGMARVSGIGGGAVELYTMFSFTPPNTNQANRYSSKFAVNTADAYLLSQSDGNSPIETAAAIFDKFISEIERKSGVEERENFISRLKGEIQGTPDFAVFGANSGESSYAKAIDRQVWHSLSISGGTRSSSRTRNGFNGDPAVLVSAAMKLSDKLPHELTRKDIMHASHCEGDTISNSISEVFAAYKVDQFIWAHEKFDNGTERISRAELLSEYGVDNPAPWETLRKILSEMRVAAGDAGLFNFDFSDPSHDELRVSNLEQYSFTAVMTNSTTGAQYNLDSLSSGEKILMAICLVSFNQYLGRHRPALLLLDELDALLHPSMVAALVTALKTLFVSKGTRVLMTSHSPMTVAALDEADIFRVVRAGGDVSVTHTTKAEAINELSEGLASVDMGLRIAAYDEAKVTILSEGNNTKHLKRWVELNFPEDVRVFEGLEQHSNDDNLLTYGRLLAMVNTNTHFVIVWDCDSAGKARTLYGELHDDANITPFAFKKREDNEIAPRGIENNYDQEILEPYSTRTMHSDGTLVSRGFPSNRKAEFADHVLRKATPQYFANYQDLRDIVLGILSPNGGPANNVSPGH